MGWPPLRTPDAACAPAGSPWPCSVAAPQAIDPPPGRLDENTEALLHLDGGTPPPQKRIARDTRPMASARDVALALQHLPPGPVGILQVEAVVEQRLAAGGLGVVGEHLRPWIALARPELFAELWPGLAGMSAFVLKACRQDRGLLGNSERFRALIAWCATHSGAALTHFLARHEAALIHAVMQLLNLGAPNLRQLSCIMGTAGAAKDDALRQRLMPHARAIQDCVGGMAREGFATAVVEIEMLLLGCGLRLSRLQMDALPNLLEGLAYTQNWFYPVGQSPQRLRAFQAGDPVQRLFRGHPAVGGEPARGSFARHLLETHPAGFGIEQCRDLLLGWDRSLDADAARRMTETFCDEGWLTGVQNGLLSVNPERVCGTMRESILANIPALDPRPSIRRQAMAPPDLAPPTRGPEPAPQQGMQDDTQPGAEEARVVFELLQSACPGQLADYVRRDPLGREHFDLEKIHQAIRPQRPDIDVRRIDICLQGETPARIAATLAARPWLREPAQHRRLRADLTQLWQQLPLLAFVQPGMTAAWINLKDPDHFCTAGILQDLLARQRTWNTRAAAALDALIDDGHIHYFMRPDLRTLDQAALHTHMGLLGLSIRADRLAMLVACRQGRIDLQPQAFIDPELWNSAGRLQQRARELMAVLGLRRGDNMPPWYNFTRALEQTLARHHPGQPARRYTGACAMQIHASLRLELELQLLPDAASKRPAEDAEPLPAAKRASGPGGLPDALDASELAGRMQACRAMPGFGDACEAIGEATGGVPPDDAFARWLARRLPWPPGASPAPPGTQPEHDLSLGLVARFLARTQGRRWLPVDKLGQPQARDGGRAFVNKIAGHVCAPGAVGLLRLPRAGQIVAVRSVDGMASACVGGGAVRLAELLAWDLREPPRRQAEFYLPCSS
ncbi:hypothetical protein GT347_18315 [Xylophilus rhododendri]|uniref:Uncharacterized protein n=1 Tax=Xylophilus rhododendri TaxID=2697032 RepID=A0A857J6X1_9BURK|nr:hypothetical protein [Xylophilus rhododendri]QHI99760.1 hypothetical protein GT347_18315 [Xylophilus rhododendri]